MFTFKRPDFGNSFSYNDGSIIRRTLGNELIITTDPVNWPKTQQMSITISGMNLATRSTFIDFYEAVAGQEIEFLDHENIRWRGFITTPKPEIVQFGRGCRFRTTFVFEGTQV